LTDTSTSASQIKRSKTAQENGTINRELALLKSAFNHATEQTPLKVRFVPHFYMLEENNVRCGFLQDEQYLRLSRECAVEGIWRAGLFETAYAYGSCRRGSAAPYNHNTNRVCSELRTRSLDFNPSSMFTALGNTARGFPSR
jgi:hypothetical protein